MGETLMLHPIIDYLCHGGFFAGGSFKFYEWTGDVADSVHLKAIAIH
jgi:hypothetical protein